MEGFLSTFAPYNVCGNPVYAPPAQGGWGKREGRFMTPQGLNYLELCKAILSQVHPSLPPALKKVNTKECGVQVNAKVDKIVQCSLGPKTLFGLDYPETLKSPTSPNLFRAQYNTPPGNSVRFMRPVSIYSPVFDRRNTLRKLSDGGEAGGGGGGGGGGGEGGEEGEDAEDAEFKDAEADPGGEDAVQELKAAVQQASKGYNFQFLEQRYGFFHCKKCNIRWESAYVWCISGTSKVYYKQLCRKCQEGFNPYRVEPVLCKGCSQTSCICEKKQRHINMKRPHRQDLCCRCRGMRLSCDATYSFKYIV